MTVYRRCTLTCQSLMPGSQPRDLVIEALLRDGLWHGGVARLPGWNGADHEVVAWSPDASGGGQAEVVAHPDGYLPADGRPVAIQVISRQARPGAEGRYQAQVAGQAVEGVCRLVEAPGAAVADTGSLQLTLIPHRPPGDPGHDRPHGSLEIDLLAGQVQAVGIGKAFKGAAARLHPALVRASTWDDGRLHLELSSSWRALYDDGDPLAEDLGQDIDWHIDLMLVEDQAVASWQVAAAGRPVAQGGGWGRLGARQPRGIWRTAPAEEQWFQPVVGWQAPVAGEHPRLLLRRADIPALRARAAQPEGQAMLARLRVLLGEGGEALTTCLNPHPHVGKHAKGPAELPVGAFTAWHPCGFATLYLATGEARYAALARQALELLWSGQMDRDERYGWRAEGLRLGPVLEGMALAYDLCYEAWDADFRAEVVRRLIDYDPSGDGRFTLDGMLSANRYPPGSNHYGAYIGGQGMVALALRHDPGVDDRAVQRWLAAAHLGVVRNLSYGFGDQGGFAEGHHPSRLSANSGFVGLLQAMRCAAGRDYLLPDSPATAITRRWIHLLTIRDDRPAFPHHGVYGDDRFDAWGLSHGGDFATGFGAIEADLVPALLWTWRQCLAGRQHEPAKSGWLEPGADSHDIMTYPHRALYALINWPLDQETVNPQDRCPQILVDTVHGHLLVRERWQDSDDIIISLALGCGPRGYYRYSQGTAPLRLWGRGLDCDIALPMTAPRVTAWQRLGDAVCAIAWHDGGADRSLLIDLSGRVAPAVLLLSAAPTPLDMTITRPAAGWSWRHLRADCGATAVDVLALGDGGPPDLGASAAGVQVGACRYPLDGGGVGFAVAR